MPPTVPVSSQTQALTRNSEYVQVNGTFFRRTPQGFVAVDFSDPNLQYLRSGAIPAQQISLQEFTGQFNQAPTPEVPKPSNPIASDLLSDPQNQALYDQLTPEQKMGIDYTSNKLTQAIEAGKVVNPAIELTPMEVKSFMDQAMTEIEPYYQEAFSQLKQDFDTSINRSIADYSKQVARARDPFQQQFKDLAAQEAEQGTAFSSERITRENRLRDQQQYQLDDAATLASRNLANVGTQFERQMGSPQARSLTLPGYQANVGGAITGTGTQTAFSPYGTSPLGEVNKARQVDLRNRSSQLEQSFRAQRTLDLANLY